MATRIAELTPREQEVRLLGKLKLRDRTQVVVFAYELGFVRARRAPASLRRVK